MWRWVFECPKIKGTHTAIKSGIVAAEAIFNRIQDMELDDEEEFASQIANEPVELSEYESSFKDSWAYKELHQVRNVRPSFNSPLGILGGLAHSGLTTMITKGSEPWTLQYHHSDADATKPASNFKPISYAKPDNELTFDLLTSVSRTGTYHDEDEPCHLRVPHQDLKQHAKLNWPKYQGIEQRFCPAGVYEYLPNEKEGQLGVRV